jgi:AraC-like DNA-binding protein
MMQDNMHRRSITGVFPILRFAIDKGIDTKAVLQGTNLKEHDLLDSRTDILLAQELIIIRNLIRHAPEPETAWELGRYFNARAHGDLGNMIASAPTVGDVISCIVDYAALSHSYFRLYPETMGNRIRVYLMENHLPEDLLPFLVERDLIAGITIMENRLPGKKHDIILSISFSHAPGTELWKYREVFIDDIAFHQPAAFFEIDRASLSMPIPDGNPQAFALFRQQCQAGYSLRNENRFHLSDRVRLLIQNGKGKTGLTEVLKKLNMSERTLRRQLGKEGTGFRTIRNRIIFQQSLHLLQDPDLQIDEIADILGYSETCAFTRSFRKWAGMSPGQYRKRKIINYTPSS